MLNQASCYKKLLFNQTPCHDDIWRNGGIAPCILNFGTRWRWVVSFIP